MAIIRSGAFRCLVLLSSLSALSTAAPHPEPDSIRYEAMGCFFYCPVFVVSVDRDGRGLFEGRRHTLVQGPRRFRMSPAQFQAFASKLEPLRPAGGSVRYDYDTRCGGAGVPVTDGASTSVAWRSGQSRQFLHFYNACPQKEVDRGLREAMALLPIKPFIGEACLRGRCIEAGPVEAW
jgi:hypothetical protein